MVKISVVMPIYNTPVSFLKEAVESILNQTVQDFEFIIVDDGSANEIKEYLGGLTDPRIRIIRNETNIGITKSLNIGFKDAHGQYIARMDSDDISLPERFEKQLAFMEAHPDVIVCGTNVEFFGSKSFVLKRQIHDMKTYRINLLFYNPGPMHPTAFLNRALLERYQITYDENLIYAQDYGLWAEIAAHGKITILPEVLLKYRVHAQQVSIKKQKNQIQCGQIVQRKLLTQLLGTVTEEELSFHYRHSPGYYRDATITPQIAEWYDRLIAANAQRKIYDQKKLKQRIVQIKRILIGQTFTKEMSKGEKAMLLFRYLPFFVAVQAVLEIMALKISNIGHKKSI